MNTVVLASPRSDGGLEVTAPAMELGLTYGQRALWFLDRLSPGNPAYLIAGAARIEGRLDVPALRRAAAALADLHPALRATFSGGPLGPVQRVAAVGAPGGEAAVDFREEWADWEDPTDEGKLAARLAALAFAPFDLAAGPLFRLVVLHLAGGGQAVALAIHHIVADFWSLAILLRDLAALYALEVGEGAAGTLPPTLTSALSYGRIVEREGELLADAAGERLWEHWREALSEMPPALELPTDRPRPAVQTYAAGSSVMRLPRETVAALGRLTRRQGATLYMGLLAGFELLLARYTGQERLVVGCPTTGRSAAEIAGLVGYLVNPVPIVGDLGGEPTVADLLLRVREAARAAFAHQSYPFALLAERLLPERDPARSPLFQAALVLQKGRRSGEEEIAAFAVGEEGVRVGFGPLTLVALPLPEPGVQFDLSVMLAESAREEGGLWGRFLYNRDLLDASTAERMVRHFQNLLAALAGLAAGAPEALTRRAFDLPFLDAAERHQLLAEWNDIPVGPVGDEMPPRVDAQVVRQLRRSPDAVAVESAAGALSYGELGRRAGRWAAQLTVLGVTRESPVAICTGRSAELVIGALAVVLAGGSYVPLDPAYPAERLAFFLADLGQPPVLTRRADLSRLPAGVAPLLLDDLGGVGDPGDPGEGEPATLWSSARAAARDRAYIIYTSGSTGLPKGVEVEHGSLAQLVAWHLRAYSLGPGDRATQVAGPAFDAAVWEIWPVLASGASLLLPSEEVRAAPDRLARWLVERGVTVSFLPTPLAEAVLAEPWPASPTGKRGALRALLTGGDRLHRAPEEGTGFALFNHYGPTESTVVATRGRVEPGTAGLPTIGRPIPGTAVYLLDRRGNPVPPGAAGELYLGGRGLARGYWGRPELTAERFVPDPFAGLAGARLYRTGDLASRRPAGDLDFLGRIDTQVKIRGVRIELGEIEAVLARHPEVREAVVRVGSGTGGERLVAYVVPRAPEMPEAKLRAYLREHLPEAMVPAAFVALAALPLTPNGKVDRQALARIAPPVEPRPTSRVPATATEVLLAGIWSRVLGIEGSAPIASGDDFFALGGHSLLATQVIARVREVFGVELPLRRLFEAPTLEALAREIEAAGDRGAGSAPPIRRRAMPEVLEGEPTAPLSFAQERLWFLDRLEPGTATYNIPGALRLRGDLSVAALASALAGIVRRHEALRTRFREVGGRPVQAITPAERTPAGLPVVDLAGLPEPIWESEARRLAAVEAPRPFDLGTGPLLRATLLKLAPAEHEALLSIHHIVADGWSVGVLVRELAALYRPAVAAPLPELPVQYADFAVWQRDWLSRDVLERELSYWRGALAGLAPLELPTDHPRPLSPERRGGRHRFALPAALSAGLARRAGEEGATLFMVLLAGLAALLARWTGREDLAVGTAVANRTHREVESLIGFFVNTLVLRADLKGDPGFGLLVGRLREVALGAYAHQDLPFEKVVEELAPERQAGRMPLFQVLFVLQNVPAEVLTLPGLTLALEEIDPGTAKLDLTLNLVETADGLAGAFEFDRDLFEPTTIARLAGHLGTLLSGVVSSVLTRLSDLPLLSAGERAELLVEWNATRVAYDRERPVHQRVAAQARQAPDAVALGSATGFLTYGELVRRASAWAERLRRLGVREETPVAICAGRSAELILGALAVLQAGGSYVPIDPAHPTERLAFFLADLGSPLVLTRRADLPRLPPGTPALLLDLGAEDQGLAVAADSPGSPAGSWAGRRAYIVYTSGSTGRPKGVEVEHGSLANLIARQIRSYALGPDDRSAQVAGPSFDASVIEIWPVLAAGASLVLPGEEERSDPYRLARFLVEREITVSFLPTPLAEAILLAPWPAEPGEIALRLLFIAGDRLHRAPERDPGFLLYNEYGPSESTVAATSGRIEPGTVGLPAIGSPIDNIQVYLLDPWGSPVPLGVAGELWLGGAGLARGYWRRPELTAERFVPAPPGLAESPGARLYRTGDLARWRAGGDLDFLGRIDDQVKVRGVRIELGEIEAVLAGHPGVREAAVGLVAGGEDGRLIGYVVPAAEEPSGTNFRQNLRSYLRDRLPEAMVPTAWVELPALPLSPNGKIDRRALSRIAPEPERSAGGALRTETEILLTGIWSRVLGIEKIASDDDFFTLGGHSLLATQVTAGVREVFGVELPLRRLFESPVLADLAREIEGRLAEGAAGISAMLAIRPRPRTGPPPLSFAQERLWFLDQLEPGAATYNVPAALRLRGTLSPAAFAWSLGEVARRQASLRTVFSPGVAGPVQVVLPAGSVALPEVDLRGLPAEVREREGRRLATAEGRRPFDLSRGPLLRAVLVQLAPEEHLALLTVHHIVSDGWSMDVLVREMGVLYGAGLRRAPRTGDWLREAPEGAGPQGPAETQRLLPALPVQYADFAAWQREWLTGETLAAQLAFWREALAGLGPLALPTDRPRPPVQTARGGFVRFSLGVDLGRELARLSREAGATLFMTLASAFAALLSRYSGQVDVAMGTPIANRRHREIEGLIGFFVNTLVLRADLAGDPSFRALLARLRQASLAAFAHQDLPFEKVVETLAPQRDPSRTPLFQGMLVLQNAPASALALPGLDLSVEEIAWGIAKFDWTLSFRETADGLQGGIEYNRDLFEETTARRWAGHLATLLSGAVGNSAARLSDLPLLSAGEHAQILAEWSRGPGDFPGEERLHDLVLDRAALQGDAVALVAEPGALSYGELARRASRLAVRLQALGVVPESVVGIYAERSLEMVVGLLGILVAGGAYLPLDPALPSERLAWMLDDGGAALVVTHGDLLLPPPLLRAGRREVRVEDAGSSSAVLAPPRMLGENAAYIIYTSGSTGLPKGVVIPHRAVAERLRYGVLDDLLPSERMLQKATIGFDISVLEIFGTLAVGGRLILARPGGQQDAEYLLDLLVRHEITYVSLPPVLLADLLDREGFRTLGSLRDVVTGGEAVPADLPGRFHSARAGIAARAADLVNRYGPTETTISVTSWRFPREAERPVPIGRPIASARIYLLDRELHPVPVGVVGELHVGGVHLARGYLGQPALTAERFVPDPLGGSSGEPGGRLYRSGDLARYQADGAIEFAGRVDSQVKIRGFRVELGEIETVLATHPGVRETVVVDRADPATGSRRLVAYAVPAIQVPALELRAYLEARLPGYMVPATFVFLAAFPLSPSGKVDRRALPEPAVEEAAYLAPRTPAEEVVAGLFADLLGLDRVGAQDDFFELGGHSLLATRLATRLRGAFGVELPLRRLFERPTVAGIAAAISEKAAGGEGSGPGLIPPLVPRREAGPIPLSFAQERLWFLEQLDPGSATYHMPGAFRLHGDLHPEILRRSLGEIVRRHGALRTTFEPEGPVQRVADGAELALPLVDLAALPAETREREGRRLAGEEAVRPFDLGRGPLLRAGLVRLEEREHLVLVTMHHIVADGWSMGVLVSELGTLYRAFDAGEPSPLAELPIQYTDFAVWQRGWLSGEVLEAEIAYWREALVGLPPLDLPTDRPRPARRRGHGALRPFALPVELSRNLARRSRAEGATLFMILLAGLAALLSRYARQEDVAVGSPIANRTREEVEGLIGFFVNTLVLRSDLSGAPAFPALLARVRERTLAAFSHQDLPFEKVVEAVAPERDTSRTPLFQVLFVLQNAPAERLELPGLTLERLELGWEAAKFDLTLTLGETADGLAGTWEYDRDLLDGPTVERLAGPFERLLAGGMNRPELPVASLPLLGEAEEEQLRVEWNDLPGERSGEAPLCLHEGVLSQARRTPEAVALVWKGERLTYGMLVARAWGLARRLRLLGVGPEVRVGVCARRSPDLVVALLGVLAAGGAYVPLDPEYPRERLALMLEDSGALLVLAGGDVADRLPAGGVRVERVEDLGASAAERWLGNEPSLPRALPGNLAYLIYTSGSTGRPKGVAIEHRNAAALVAWGSQAFTAAELDSVLASTSVCFDLSIFELFVPLSLGGRVVLAENALALPDLPGAWEVSLVNTVPSAMGELVRGGRLPGSVRTVNLAGEPLPRTLAEGVYAAGATRVLNLYGPSEDTTYSTVEEVARGAAGEPAIGRPLAGGRGYVVERAGWLAPLGVPGELWLGGAGLARGYLGRPELSAERFVPDPWSGEPGARLYRTGDLARFRPDGRLAFLGRIDHQVKVRGFRIELGELEAALLAHPEVREAVVLARQDVPGDLRLVAYVVGGESADDLSGALRRHLAERLPEYMIPAAFVRLAALPLHPNGKIDRRALPAPEWRTETAYLAPRTPTEEVLAGLFADLLGIEKVGARDDFFALGGHSLLAARLTARLRQVFGVELPLRRIFEHPTVAGLAAAVETARSAGSAGSAAPPLLPARLAGPAPLSFAQERLWFLDQLDPGSFAYHMPGAFRLVGTLDVPALRESLGEIVRRHDALRTTFAVPEGGEGQSPEQRLMELELSLPGLPISDLGGLPAEAREIEAKRLARAEAVRPFDLERGPLFRAGLIRTGTTEHLVLVTMHHIVSDGWSMGVLVAELGALYPAFAAGRPSPLPPLPIQYVDFAVWQRAWLSGEVLESQAAYWRQALGGLPPLDLPTDRPRPARRRGRGAVRPLHLPRALGESLARFSREEGATLFMTLVAGLSALLSRYTGQDDLAVGSPIAGRTRAEIEGLIGFFVNTLVLRADLAGAPGFRALVARLRERTLAAFSHQDLPFEKVVSAVAPERDTSRTPLFQVFLVLQNAPAGPLELPGLTVSPLALDWEAAKFDLTLTLAETASGLAGSWEYDRDLFDPPTVERLSGHFERLLAGMIERPELAIPEQPILGDAEREQVRAQWNDLPRLELGEAGCLHERVAVQAERTPEAIALVWNDENLSYGALLARARRLARRLRDLGVGPEVRVGVCARRTPDLVAALLGVLAAGGAYVPLDPEYPRERLGFMLADSGAGLVIAGGDVADRLPAGEARILDLHEMLGAGPEGTGESAAGPGNLAYLIYTSGSTGRPKGVAIEHRSAVALVNWASRAFSAEELSGVLAATSVCFDLSVFEIFVPLALGGRVVLAASALALPDLPGAWGVSLVNTVPSALQELVRGGRLPGSVRTVNLAGEPLPRALAEAVHAGGVPRVLNLYGPSEDTTYSTIEDVAAGAPDEPSIGRPLPGSHGYVVDRAGQLSPAGVPGELQLGGAGLARGYLGGPELTAERFVPDPWSGKPGARLYRTGDLVRFRPEGRLGFLGRIDHQVKVRGFRIELGEIETALLAAPGIREAVVLARRDTPGTPEDLRLVAYVVASETGNEDLDASLRRRLAERLPEYMVPAAFVRLPALPRTPNGKLDRKALPAPEWKAGTDYLAPRTAIEEVLAGIFSEILGISRVGVLDSFFRLGGHSLLATQLVSRVQGTFRVKLPLRRLFETPTVAALAAAVLAGEERSGQSEKIARALLRLRGRSNS